METSWPLQFKPPGRRAGGWRKWAALFLFTTGWANGLAATFTATLDRATVAVGESAVLTLNFDGEPKEIPSPPAIANLQIESQGSSRSMTIVNNQVSSTISHTFTLTPLQQGEYTIPALQAEVVVQVLKSEPLKLVAKPGERLAFFKLVLPRKEVFVGEVFAIELQVYIRQGVANADNILQNFDEFNGPCLKAEGFSVLRMAHARRRQAQVEGNTYQVATLVSALSALKTGTLSIGSMDVKFVLQLALSPGRFGFMQYQNRQVALNADPESVTVLNLPRENVPANFNGAVGSYALSVSAGPTNVGIGDPITVRVQISGKGALDALALPEQPAWRDFKTFPPTAKVDLTDPLGLQGSKTFEQVVIPQSADIKALPPVSFSFFDPDQKKYQVASQPALPLVVKPAGAVPAPTVVAGSRNAGDSPSAQDIVHIKQHLGSAAAIGLPLVQQPWFLALQSVPLLLLGGAVAWRRRVELLANNPRLRRRRLVAQIVKEGLATLRRYASSRDTEAFFATLFRLLQEQLGERLDLPASSITEAIIEEHLRPRGVPDNILARLQETFHSGNVARYAPVKTSQELESLIPKAEALLNELKDLDL